MMKKLLIALMALGLSGCATHSKQDDQIDIEYGWVKIYSTKNITEAQGKADSLCSSHAYFLNSEYESNLKNINKSDVNRLIFNYIPFQCDVFYAAKAGNLEAKKIANAKLSEAHNILDEKKKVQYEIHKEYAQKHGGDSFSIVNPDGSVEAHAFDGTGNECHASASQFGSETSCD